MLPNSRQTIQRLLIACLSCAALLIPCFAYAQGALPRLIRKHNLSQHLKHLVLSDEQLAQIGSLHDIYLTNWSESFDPEIQSFNAAWGSVYVNPDDFTEESMERTYSEAKEKAERLAAKLRVANDSFFDSVELLLADEQLPGMQRVRLGHERFSYKRTERGLRERQLDVVAIVDEMNLDDDDRKRVENVLQDFEPVFVQALRNAAESDQRRAVHEFAVMDLMRLVMDDQPDIQEKKAALLEKAGKLSYSAFNRLVETNRKGLRQLMGVLSGESAAELERRYKEEAYPEIYPDPAFAEPIFIAADKLEDLTEDQRAALQLYREMYANEHVSLSKKLADHAHQRTVANFRAAPGHDEKALKAEEEIRRLAMRREQLNLSQPGRIRSMLLPEQNERLKPWIYETKSPPRPWGDLARLSSEEMRATREAVREQQREIRRTSPQRSVPKSGTNPPTDE